jgi:hypothetical protein
MPIPPINQNHPPKTQQFHSGLTALYKGFMKGLNMITRSRDHNLDLNKVALGIQQIEQGIATLMGSAPTNITQAPTVPPMQPYQLPQRTITINQPQPPQPIGAGVGPAPPVQPQLDPNMQAMMAMMKNLATTVADLSTKVNNIQTQPSPVPSTPVASSSKNANGVAVKIAPVVPVKTVGNTDDVAPEEEQFQ